MDVILHIGSHRTGSTTFQSYMNRSRKELFQRGIGYWGPRRTRKGLFKGLFDASARKKAEERVQTQLTYSARNGLRKVLVSDENMIGSVRYNLRHQMLYPSVGDRMARYAFAFEGQVSRVVLNIRSHEHYWASAISYGVSRGHQILPPNEIENIAIPLRTWRDVIVDLSDTLPSKVQIEVLPFEQFQGQPSAMLAACLGEDAPQDTCEEWLNSAPDTNALRHILAERGDISSLCALGLGKWMPFDERQKETLREAYAEDLHWLIAGADGLATLTENTDQCATGNIPQVGSQIKGQEDDKQKKYMAGPR